MEVRNKLTAYMDTPDYEQFLYQKCRQAMEFAAGEEVILYIDQADSIHQHSLMQKLGVKPELSREIFMGGMRAVIPIKKYFGSTILLRPCWQTPRPVSHFRTEV